MATLEEIRKKLQQAKQKQNAVAASPLSSAEKKRRLKRLNELLARLKRGDDRLPLTTMQRHHIGHDDLKSSVTLR